jgi:hypothetical protein
MARNTSYLLLMLIISGCSTSQIDELDKVIDVSNIIIDKTSKQSDGSVEMITRCSGFILSEKEVRHFLVHAAHIRDNGPDKYHRILPCSATGTAVIDKRKYNWVIRAGGVGELISGEDRIIAVCGKKCCEKVPGAC